MTQRKRGTDIVTPPRGVTIPEDHNEVNPPKPVAHSYHRVIWIVADKYIEPQAEGWERYSIVWVLADRDGNVKATYTGKRSTLPAKFKRILEA